MPAWRTVYDWIRAHPDFATRIAHARELGFDAIADAVADRAQVLGVQLDPPEIFEIAAQHAAMV